VEEDLTGAIAFFAFTGTPVGWARCDGKLLSINSYPGLYSLLGNRFGGNYSYTFALPKIANTLTDPSLCVGWCICLSGIYPHFP
jgi:microcystin-dependent protein